MESSMLDKMSFRSVYAKHIIELIELKRKLGMVYSSGEWYLRDIDRFAAGFENPSEGFTKEFVEQYSEPRLNENHGHRYTRVRYLLELSTFIKDKGIPSYLPRLLKYQESNYIPFIFSQKEINNLFTAADKLVVASKSNGSNYLFCIPAILRLLYSTGLRVGEAIELKISDVDLLNGTILIRKSKNGRQRIIPISKSLADVLKQYLFYRGELINSKETEYLFITPNGEQCKVSAVRSYFMRCLRDGIESDSVNSGSPRVHDLRHSFAVHAMAQMIDNDIDLYASLPILSTYLGHSSIGATEHYVRLTKSIYPELIKDVDNLMMNIFPKINRNETN